MLTVLIRKDDATEIPRQVADIEAARALDSADMPAFVLEGGVKIPVAQYGIELATDEVPASALPPDEPAAEVPAEPQAPSDEPADPQPV